MLTEYIRIVRAKAAITGTLLTHASDAHLTQKVCQIIFECKMADNYLISVPYIYFNIQEFIQIVSAVTKTKYSARI